MSVPLRSLVHAAAFYNFNVNLKLDQRRRRWPNFEATLSTLSVCSTRLPGSFSDTHGGSALQSIDTHVPPLYVNGYLISVICVTEKDEDKIHLGNYF